MAKRSFTHTTDVTIADGASLSESFEMAGKSGVLYMPAAWTAANIGFMVSSTKGGTYVPLYNSSAVIVEMTVVVDSAYSLPAELSGANFVKLRSASSGTPVNQSGADRSIRLTLKD